MKSCYPQIPLHQVITQDVNYIHELEPRLYPKLSVKLYGRGVVLDSPTDGATVQMKRHQLAKPGQIILSEIWAKKGAIGIVPIEGEGALVTSHFFLFDIDKSKVMAEFISWLLRANYFAQNLDAEARGTTGYAAIRPKQFLQMTIPLPPLDEQRHIVARIEALAGRVAEAQRLRAEAMAEAKTLIETCTDEVLMDLASKYESHKFSQICTTITDGDHITPQYATEGVRFIFVGNVSSGHLHFNNCKYVTEEYFATISPQRKPKRGDILYSAVGATLGIPAIVDVDEPFCFQRHIAILKPDPAIVDSRFAWHLLQAGQIYRKAWSLTTGSAQPTVPLRAIRALEIPIPPIQEQRQVVTYLDDLYGRVDALKRLQTGTSAELDALLPAILDKAFRGEL